MKKVFKFTGGVLIVAAVLLTVFWFSRPADIRLEDLASPIAHQAYSHFVTVDQVRLHYQEKGNGPALVLIHGYGASTQDWSEVFDPLAQRFRVIAVDLKGFGFSEKRPGDYAIPTQAGLVLKFLDQLGIERASVCGNSMGGAVALLCALNDPRRVERLILVDSVATNQAAWESGLVPRILLKPVIGPILGALALTSDDIVRHGLSRSLYDKSLATPQRLESYYRPLRTRNGQQATLAVARQWDLSILEKNLHRVQPPTLIVWGADDELIPLKHGQSTHQHIRGSQLVVFPQCGHVPQIEKPREFVETVSKFLSSE
jgi:pimeloyl-ACP methyl ester carboxylesterase